MMPVLLMARDGGKKSPIIIGIATQVMVTKRHYFFLNVRKETAYMPDKRPSGYELSTLLMYPESLLKHY